VSKSETFIVKVIVITGIFITLIFNPRVVFKPYFKEGYPWINNTLCLHRVERDVYSRKKAALALFFFAFEATNNFEQGASSFANCNLNHNTA
jgi:hypothetical protein